MEIEDKYAISLPNNLILSGFKNSNICSLINAYHNYNNQSKIVVQKNVQYTYHKDRFNRVYVFLISIRNIKKGGTIWGDYGEDYWI